MQDSNILHFVLTLVYFHNQDKSPEFVTWPVTCIHCFMQFLCKMVNVNNVGTFPLVLCFMSVLLFPNPFGSAERGRVCAASCIWSLGRGGEERDLRDAQSRTVRFEVFFSSFFFWSWCNCLQFYCCSEKHLWMFPCSSAELFRATQPGCGV